ncbi:MAG: transcriptional regulator [Porticoccaceae bacterium]|mgnify:CR=1 FL=1|jgi:putative transcriptional regulator|nr:transcriptional regulator [Porticoccaceae bacterium]MBT5578531.1 transcriptional regulator [Porticoccaceae bacterium]MBT7375370.1 transcriptional regulator [Porticoccaceae bacterium]
MSNQLSFHPDNAMLVEFSAGTLETALSICVSAHLHFCSQCRSELMQLDHIGSQLMSAAEPAEVDDSLFDDVMAKIDSVEAAPAAAPSKSKGTDMPFTVNKLIKEAEQMPIWKRLSGSVDVARLKTGQEKFEVALHRICAGGKTPKHDHSGVEYTVVLKGSLSDERSVYKEGDFLVRQPGDVHQPMGGQNGDCICLSALAAPIKLTNPLGFLMKPWLRINPM